MEQSLTIEGKRNRKTIQRLDMSISVSARDTSAKTIDWSKGRGDRLGDIERVNFQIDRTKAEDLKTLYRLCINGTAKVNFKSLLTSFPKYLKNSFFLVSKC